MGSRPGEEKTIFVVDCDWVAGRRDHHVAVRVDQASGTSQDGQFLYRQQSTSGRLPGRHRSLGVTYLMVISLATVTSLAKRNHPTTP